MSTPTVLTRNDFSVLPWTDSKDVSEAPIEKLYQFPTDFDIDKVTNNYAVASDVSKQRVYVFNILKTTAPAPSKVATLKHSQWSSIIA
jgi:hypothetical protein